MCTLFPTLKSELIELVILVDVGASSLCFRGMKKLEPLLLKITQFSFGSK